MQKVTDIENPNEWAFQVDWSGLPTPVYVVDAKALERNLSILRGVQDRTGCRILMALKGFAMFSIFPRIRRHLDGVAASSLDEARLGFEEFGKEVHVFSPGYLEAEFHELLGYVDHVIFNSFSQWERFKPLVEIGRASCRERV